MMDAEFWARYLALPIECPVCEQACTATRDNVEHQEISNGYGPARIFVTARTTTFEPCGHTYETSP